MALQGTPMETDDPITSYMLQVCFEAVKSSLTTHLISLTLSTCDRLGPGYANVLGKTSFLT
jgi:hypothetical protein